jgi:hypothetical protein
MKKFLRSRDGASKGAALMIVLAMVVLLAGVALAYFSRTTTDRQLAQSSYNDTSSDLLARTALDIVVGDFKQELLAHPTVTPGPPFYIQPARYGDASIPNLIRRSFSGDPTNRTSTVSSTSPSANGRSISTTRWNSHYLIPRGAPSDLNTNPSPTPTFVAPDWVLVTGQGPAQAPSPSAVIGRYAFAVYDEGGLLDMTLAGYPSWTNCVPTSTSPTPTPWLLNVGRKGIMAFADLTALPAASSTFTQSQVDNIVGWRNYAMTQRTPFPSFGNFSYAGEQDCAKQDWYGSYLLYFGDPPFSIESLSDKLLASTYPFTSVSNYMYPTPAPNVTPRTDQALTTRQELLRLRSSLNISQNVLQYMGTFSRERNRPAPDWPNLSGHLGEGRFNLNNLALVVPNPGDCNIQKGQKKGWQTGKNRNHLCGTPTQIIELFGLFWVTNLNVPPGNCPFGTGNCPGYWKYVDHTGPNPPGDPNPNPNSIICWDVRGRNQQLDFFQVLHYALNVARNQTDRCGGAGQQPRTFGIGASLIDQYDSGGDCSGALINWGPGCDLDSHVVNPSGTNRSAATHTTVIQYGQGGTNTAFAYGMEPNYSDTVGSDGHINGDDPWNGDCSHNQSGNNPHRPCGAPAPVSPVVISHAFSNTGELGYGIDTSLGGPTPGPTPLPTLDFSSPNFYDAPVLDFFSYNPISSAYPRAGIVNLYTKNAPVIAAMLAGTLKNDVGASPTPNPLPIISGTPAATSEAMRLANAIVAETQGVLAGAPPSGWSVTRTDMTRAIAARLAARATNVVWGAGTADEIKKSIARSLAEMGQTRTWNLFIDVIAQTGRYAPDATDINQANKFTVEGEKRYWLHIALGRDLVHTDGTPCLPGETGCQVDVLGSQVEEVVE